MEKEAQYLLSTSPVEKNFSVSIQVRISLNHNSDLEENRPLLASEVGYNLEKGQSNFFKDCFSLCEDSGSLWHLMIHLQLCKKRCAWKKTKENKIETSCFSN